MSNVARFSDNELIEAFNYLDELRDSGETNMFGAASYIVTDLEHSKDDARDLLSAWMKTFDGKSSVEARVQKARVVLP